MDFIGIQNDTREVERYSPFMLYVNAKVVKASARNVETTTMDWEVDPESIYCLIKKIFCLRWSKESYYHGKRGGV